ncbi:MAG: class I SAM-dependent methyltransferase, partial [Planctomycetota bacterium]|nr:class I SAM-dependent methyltransferase [Planctomycetota bacterium]
IAARYGAERVAVLRLNGSDLREIADASFDLVAAYSVLHHIPDYVKAVAEMARVTRPGGIIYLDHEANEAFWQPSEEYRRFQREARYLSPWQRLIKSLRRRWRERDDGPNHEGDIHVHAEDHVEWDKVRAALAAGGCAVLWQEDYLLFKTKYRRDVWERYRHRLADYRCLVARKT